MFDVFSWEFEYDGTYKKISIVATKLLIVIDHKYKPTNSIWNFIYPNCHCYNCACKTLWWVYIDTDTQTLTMYYK